MFEGIFNSSIIKRAREKDVVTIEIVNLRDFGTGKHKTVDDKPYGGGVGMVLKVDILHKAIEFVKKLNKNTKIILLDPAGKKFNQSTAEELSKEKSITLLCGHYEGFDARVRKFVDFEISLGDFVLTGGEIPAMAVVDSIVRLIPNVLGKDESTFNESFSKRDGKRILEYDQYTRPEVFQNLSVPSDILSGDPKKVSHERLKSSFSKTKKRRPDLLFSGALDRKTSS